MSDTITITGNIGADPERRQTGTGVPVTTFRVASSQRRFDRTKGEWVETGTNWYQVSAFRQLGEHAFTSLHRGERVIVTGRLRLRQWETATKSGLSVEIDADGIGHDLLWGTTQYSRAERSGQSWAVPGVTDAAEPAPDGIMTADSWATTTLPRDDDDDMRSDGTARDVWTVDPHDDVRGEREPAEVPF